MPESFTSSIDMSMAAFSLAFLAAFMQFPLPTSVLFNNQPATMEQMRRLEGVWVTSSNVLAFKLLPSRLGWMSFEAGKAIPEWIGRRRFPVAVTTNDGQLFISMSVRSMAPMWGIKKSYHGVQCYNTFAVVSVADGINIRSLDEDKMRTANQWYPEELPSWEGKQLSCEKFVRRARAARDQHVIVVLDQEFWFDGPLHRLPAVGSSTDRRSDR